MVASKVYLSKSNHSDPDRVMRVRDWLENKGYTVIEHTGGEYDESLLAEAKIMIMVGPKGSILGVSKIAKVGKGQFEQLRYRRRLRGMIHNYYVIGSMMKDSLYTPILKRVTLGGVVDTDNWVTNYGELRVNRDATVSLPSITSKCKDEPEYEPEPENTRKIHLACIDLF